MSTIVAPLEVHRYPDGEQHNTPFLVSVLCPICEDVHTHAVSVRAVGEGFTWDCTCLLRHGRYRLAVLPTLGAMWDLLSPPSTTPTTGRTTP